MSINVCICMFVLISLYKYVYVYISSWEAHNLTEDETLLESLFDQFLSLFHRSHRRISAGLGFGVWGSSFEFGVDQGSGFRVQGSGFRVQGAGFGVQG